MVRWGISWIAIASAWAAAAQVPVQFPSLEDAKLIDAATGQVEARLRADTTNWDMRLGFDGTPKPTDATANLLNGRGAFADSTFNFSIEYASIESVYAFSVTGPEGKGQSIKAQANDVETINAIRFSTSGSSGKVSLWDVAMKGGGFAWSGMRELTSGPGGDASNQSLLYFGDGIDLTSTDWVIAGNVSFGELSSFNPSEGAKMTISLFNAVPSPASTGLVGVSALIAVRRRR